MFVDVRSAGSPRRLRLQGLFCNDPARNANETTEESISMGSLSIWHWLIVLVVVLVLFGGRGKISQIMGDFGKGLKSFKKSMREDESFDDAGASGDPKALPSDPTRASTAPRGSDPVRESDHVARP